MTLCSARLVALMSPKYSTELCGCALRGQRQRLPKPWEAFDDCCPRQDLEEPPCRCSNWDRRLWHPLQASWTETQPGHMRRQRSDARLIRQRGNK